MLRLMRGSAIPVIRIVSFWPSGTAFGLVIGPVAPEVGGMLDPEPDVLPVASLFGPAGSML
jgi:hypothetical protein